MTQISAHISEWRTRIVAWLPGDLRAMAAFSLSGAVGSLIGIVTGPLILRKVGLAEFGFLGLALFVHNLFNTIADFGIPAHLITVSSRRGERDKTEIVHAFILKGALLCGVGGLYLGYLLGYPHPREVKELVGAYLSVLVFSAGHLEWLFISRRHYRDLVTGRVLAAATMALLIAWWFLFGRSLWFIPVGTALAQATELAYLGSRIPGKSVLAYPLRISWNRVGGIFLKVAPMAGTQILSPFFLASGIFLMQKFQAPAEWIGAYNVAQRVVIGWLALIGPLILFLIPKLSGRAGRSSLSRVAGLAAAITLGFLIAGSILIGIFYLVSGDSGEYLRFSLSTYAILMLGIFMNLARLQTVSGMITNGHYGRYFLVHAVSALPVALLAVWPGWKAPTAAIPWIACLPECIATGLSLSIGPGSTGTSAGRPSGFPERENPVQAS